MRLWPARVRETVGVVRIWHAGEGFGVIDSDETPGGIGTVFSSILSGSAFRTLRPGQRVRVKYVHVRQDDCPYQAVEVDPEYDGTDDV